MEEHNCIFYGEAESLDCLMMVIDEGFRALAGTGEESKFIAVLSGTDTRFVSI